MQLLREDLDAAVKAGILDGKARDRLVAFMVARNEGSTPDAESFRLLTGFNDIFVSLACVLLLGALASLLAPPFAPAAVAPAAVAIASWGLAEYFTARRRMALPSIVLLLSFVGAVFAFTVQLLANGADWLPALQQPASDGRAVRVLLPLMLAGLAAAVAAVLHWRRFRVPITLAAGAAGLAIGLMALAAAVIPGGSGLLLAALVAGLAIFALAMRYDIADRERTTRSTDIAFWLHLLAAPLIVHPVFALSGLLSGAPAPGAALLVLGVYALLTLIALLIDRRALLVSALVYVLYALQGLFAAGEVAAGFGLTALILGSFLLMLSAAWGGLRRRLVQQAPPYLAQRLPAAA